jgi:hypothetical protein
MHETWEALDTREDLAERRATARFASTLDKLRPTVAALITDTLSISVMTSPLILFTGPSPGGLFVCYAWSINLIRPTKAVLTRR